MGRRNADGNKITFILVGTKSDKVFQSGAAILQKHDDEIIQEEKDNMEEELDAILLNANEIDETASQEQSSFMKSQQVEDPNNIDVIAKAYAKRKGFAKYLATSALFGSNVKTVFDEAIELTYMNRKEKLKHLDTKGAREGSQNRPDEITEKKKRCTIFWLTKIEL